MAYWTNKQRGAVIGVALVVAIALLGLGTTALGVLVGLGGYYVGKWLDGELDLEEIRARAQARLRSGQTNAPGGAPTVGPEAAQMAGPREGTAAGTVVGEPVRRTPTTGGSRVR